MANNTLKVTCTIDWLYKYHGKSVDFTFNKKDKQIWIINGKGDIVIDLDELKILNEMVKELGWLND